MDENLTKQLRDAGGLVGFSNVDEWQQLVDRNGVDQVLAAIVRVKKVSGRGAFISGVRVDLGAKGREPAPPKPGSSMAPGGPVGAEAVIARKEKAAGESTMAVDASGRLAAPVPVATATVEEELEAEQETIDEESGNDPDDDQVDESEDDNGAPAEKADTTPEQERMLRARQARTFRVSDHYLKVLREFPGISLTEFANRAGRDPGAASSWVSTHADLVTTTSEGRRKRFWIKDDPRIAAAAAEAASRPAAPARKSTRSAQVTPTVEESAPPAPEVVQPAAAPELVTGEDLRDRLKDTPEPPLTGLVIFADDLAGPLRPLLEMLLDAFAQRRGYTHTVRELAECQDLVGVRR